MPKLLGHSPDLPLPALSQNDAQSGVVFLVADNGDLGRCRSSVVQIDSPSPSLECLILWMAFHVNTVFLSMLITRMSEKIGQLAVVGEQYQPFAIQVQTTHGIELAWKWHQVTHRAMAAGVVPYSGEDALRLMERNITEGVICPHRPPVNCDPVLIRDNPLA
jgi:hypothetical protein